MRDKNGFTLIEIILAIAIIGLVITALFNINMAGFNFLNYNQDRVELQNQARLITTNLEKYIRNGVFAKEIYNKKALVIITPNDSDNNIIFYVNDNKRLIMGYIDETIDVIESYSLTTINSYLYNQRNITAPVIISNEFNKNINDRLVSFTFELNKDKSNYIIKNKFYPRVLN